MLKKDSWGILNAIYLKVASYRVVLLQIQDSKKWLLGNLESEKTEQWQAGRLPGVCLCLVCVSLFFSRKEMVFVFCNIIISRGGGGECTKHIYIYIYFNIHIYIYILRHTYIYIYIHCMHIPAQKMAASQPLASAQWTPRPFTHPASSKSEDTHSGIGLEPRGRLSKWLRVKTVLGGSKSHEAHLYP